MKRTRELRILRHVNKQTAYLQEIVKLVGKLQESNVQLGLMYAESLPSIEISNSRKDKEVNLTRVISEETRNKQSRQKFIFNNRTLSANQTVLAIISDLAKQKSLQEIRTLFPQKSISPKRRKLLIFATREEAKHSSSDYEARYYINNPIIDVDGTEFFVTNQWIANTIDQTGHANFLTFVDYARKVGISIQPAS